MTAHIPTYTARQMTYDSRGLRRTDLIRRAAATHRYELTRAGRVRCLPWSPRRACPRYHSPEG
jgi:hypothetical protein